MNSFNKFVWIMALSLSVACIATASSVAQYDLSWATIDAGGGTVSGDSYELKGTIGQTDVGTMSGGNWELQGGFWPGIEDCTLLGDVNLDGNVNLLDVDEFIDRIASGEYQAEADCNQDEVVNLLDVDEFIQILSGG